MKLQISCYNFPTPAKRKCIVGKWVRFLKRWTLPMAMAVGASSYLLFSTVPHLQNAALLLGTFFDTMYPWLLFAILFVTFNKVNFHQLRLVRWHTRISMVQAMLLVSLMLVLIFLPYSWNSTHAIAESTLACVIAPTATAAPIVASKLGGNLEEMTTYTFLSNLLTALYVPLLFPLVSGHYGNMSFLTLFLPILYKVCWVLVLPMLLAWLVKHLLPRLHRRIVRVRDLSFYLWACSLAIITGITVKNIVHATASATLLLIIALAALAGCLLQFKLGHIIGKSFMRQVEAGQGLGQKNTSFAIWIAYTYLTPLAAVGPGCYILWQNIINSVELRRQEPLRISHIS